MITKELENILKSFPSFLRVISDLHNPLNPAPTIKDPLKTVTEAVWFVVPFHFLSFLGLVPLQGSHTAVVLVAGFATLLGLSWIGSLLGTVAATLQGQSGSERENSVSAWVTALVVTWFFCVLIISSLNFGIWLFEKGADLSIWPDLLRELQPLLYGTVFKGEELLLISVFVPLLSALLMIATMTPGNRGTWPQRAIVIVTCAIACCAFIVVSARFLQPVTRLDTSGATQEP